MIFGQPPFWKYFLSMSIGIQKCPEANSRPRQPYLRLYRDNKRNPILWQMTEKDPNTAITPTKINMRRKTNPDIIPKIILETSHLEGFWSRQKGCGVMICIFVASEVSIVVDFSTVVIVYYSLRIRMQCLLTFVVIVDVSAASEATGL